MHCFARFSIVRFVLNRIAPSAREALTIAALLALAACGGSGSGGTPAANQTPEPTGEPPAAPIDRPQLDFSPSIPISGSPTSLLSDSPAISLTLNYPESGIPAGNRMVISAYVEDPDSLAPGTPFWQQVVVTRGEDNYQTAINAFQSPIATLPDGSVTILVDVVVFNDDETAGAQLEYAAIPRARVEFSAQEQDGQRVYERIAFERDLEAIMLASETADANYVQALSLEDEDSAITIEHSSFFNNNLYLLVNYANACEEDEFEVQLQVEQSDLAAKLIPTSVRRTTSERCSDTTSRLLTINLDGMTDRYAAFHDTVFEPIVLQGLGSFTPTARTFDSAKRFGTEPFCDANPGCLASVVLETNGRVSINTYTGSSSSSRYSVGADGRTIYLEGNNGLIPNDGTAIISEDGRSVALSFLGFVFFTQPDTYTYLTVQGSVDVPALNPNENYHAAVILFSPSGGGIDILGREIITDFSANNASFRIEYKAEDLPTADPLSLQIAAAIFSGEERSEAPAALAYRSVFPGNALSFNDTNTNENVFEAQLQTQIAVAQFSGMRSETVAELIDEELLADSQSIADLQFASIYGSFLHLILGGDSACQVDGGRFQVYYPTANNVPQSGLPSRWLKGTGAPCASPLETQVSIDLRPLITERLEPGEPAPETLEMARYGNYTPVLTLFPERRVYVDTVGCFAQGTCGTSLDFGPDGALNYQRSVFVGAATYGISIDGRTIFSEGIPLSAADTTAVLSEDGQSMTTRFAGELFREL